MATMVARLAISPLIPAITSDFGVSNAAVGLALSLMWGAYALAQFPSGILGDRFGEQAIILSAVGLTGFGSLFLAIAPTYGFFVFFAIVLGGGAGLHYTVATTLLTKQFENIGRAVGFHITGSPVAGLVAPVAAAMIGAQFGWRAGMLLGAAVALPTFGLIAWKIRPTEPERPEQSMRRRFTVGSMAGFLSRPPIVFSTLLALLCAFVWQATASFLPIFFVAEKGLSPTLSSVLFSTYFVAHGVTQPLLGALSDRIGRDPTVALAMAVGVVGYGSLTVGNSLVILGLGVISIGLAMSWGAPLQSRIMDLFTADEQGAGFGLVRTVYMTTGALGSVVVGFVADVGSWTASFGLLTTILSIVLALVVLNQLFRLGL